MENPINVMGTGHSEAYAEIINIINVATSHRDLCPGEDCKVMLYLLGRTARKLVRYVYDQERMDIIMKIEDTNWM